ncbi:MAG TPA: M1 family metallopeptidase [Thermoanaerobaculia bacterium]|jgi:aminopeptidase N|nr:M1 family metallopeptidase [Thermoanaerobaculia bacterium]
MLKRGSASIAVFLFAFPLFAQNAAVDVLHYRVDITLPRLGDEIHATTELTVRPIASTLESLQLDFAGLTIDSVRVEGKPATFERAGDRLTLLAQRTTNEPFRVEVRYHGSPKDGLLLQANKHGDPSVFADNWPNRARFWIPSVDHPSDKATVEFIVTSPAAYTVIANGTLLETKTLADGVKRTHWSESTPIPVHCMVIGATEFAVVPAGANGVTRVAYWLYPRDRENGIRQFGRVAEMLAYFDATIGAYPYDKLALVESSTKFGGMENASAIFLDEKRINGEGSLEGLAAHEVAHQWFGDSVTQRQWHDVWLSEGFATYFCNLFFEHADGRAAFLERMRVDRSDYLNAQRKQPRAIHDLSIVELPKLLGPFTYEKGAWVLHMLRGIMGDRAFFAAVRDYYSAYRDRNAATGELRVIMERHAGQPLDWFFQQWIFERGHPIFTTSWTWANGKVALDVAQKQDGPVFRVPTVIEVRSESGNHRESVVIAEREQRFELDSERRPAEVVIDPDEWVLKELQQ